MLWLITSFAFAWNLRDVNNFCKHPPDTTPWVNSTFEELSGGQLSGRGTNRSNRYFNHTDSVHIFESDTNRVIGLSIGSELRYETIARSETQIMRHYVIKTDGPTRFFELNSDKNLS